MDRLADIAPRSGENTPLAALTFPGLRWLCAGGAAVLDLLYPPVCVGCEKPLAHPKTLCDGCRSLAEVIEAPFCATCSQPYEGAIEGEFACANCRGGTFAFDCAIARYRSRGVVRELIHRFKYEREFYLRRALSHQLREALDDERMRRQAIDAFVPVPLHPRRLRDRGFNQSEALCRLLGKETHLPILSALRRTRFTETQTHFSREERKRNLRKAFAMRRRQRVAGLHLVLVDDVFTTGSTVHECARVLRQAGAASVRVLAVARG